MFNIFTYAPIFKYETPKNSKEYNVANEIRHYRTGISRLYEVFVSLIGEIRRFEYKNSISNRVSFDINIFYNYLADKNLQKEFIELSSKTVDGHIINRINDRLRQGIKERVYKGMGYEYIPPKKEEQTRHFNINETQF